MLVVELVEPFFLRSPSSWDGMTPAAYWSAGLV
jgi:hypothetical protein